MPSHSKPDSVTCHETVWIPLSDGVRLAARVWIPTSAETEPVPAILEYTPYRRRDGSRDNDERTHPYLAAHGFGCVRLDIRGTGDSEGVIRDEYLQQEQDDAVEAIAWIAAQPWCNGRVGMMGISWGGFNALQVAARRPPALQAIVTICSTDDRYADDMHYMGGCHTTGNVEWGSTFFSVMAGAPDPLVVGEKWRSMWRERLEAITPMVATTLEHQRRDTYWRHGSVCEDISAIQCPVLVVGGWADGYTNAVFRLLEHVDTPRPGIVGPWGHKRPHLGVPGPAIGFLTEMIRWWSHWLKDEDTGVMQEPMLRAFLQDWIPPATHYDTRPGQWVAEPTWPSPHIAAEWLSLNAAGLGASALPGAWRSVSSPQTTGATGGEWCPYSLGGLGPELPGDQRPDDAFSLVFDGEPLAEAMDILGAPILEIVCRSDRPQMQIAARLNDVAPDGRVARVSYGVLNLTHRESHARPEPLVPGREYRVRVQLNDTGHSFAPGHRLRIALSTTYWPIIWPSPEPGVLEIATGRSSVTLPVRKPRGEEGRVSFAPPEKTAPGRRRQLVTGRVHRISAYDAASGEQSIEVLRNEGRSLIEEIGVETGLHKVLRYRILPDDPTSARTEAEYSLVHRHAFGWDTTIKTRTVVTCTASDYVVAADLEAFDGEQRIFARSWTQRIARDFT